MSKCRCTIISSLLGFLFLVPSILLAQDSTASSDTVSQPLSFDEYVDSVVVSQFVYDSSSFEPRMMSSQDFESYRGDEEFDYARKTQPPTNLFARILDWFFRLFGNIFGNKVTGEILTYAFFGVALILVIWLIARNEGEGLFVRRGKVNQVLDFEEVPEDIHTLDFDRLITEAVAGGEFRRAVRLHYLQVLQAMNERDLIEWRREKTNGDYLREISQTNLHSRFANLTFVFDYIWYGGFEIRREDYSNVSQDFASFASTVERGG